MITASASMAWPRSIFFKASTRSIWIAGWSQCGLAMESSSSRLFLEGVEEFEWKLISLVQLFFSFLYLFLPIDFQITMSENGREKKSEGLHRDPFYERKKRNCLPMKSMGWAEVELLCLNKIKLNHFVIVSMMKHSEIYWITSAGKEDAKKVW